MKIWVTGAAGFVGFRLAMALAKEGHEVVGSVRCLSSAQSLPKARLVEMDLQDEAAIHRHFDAETFDLVIHCASQQPREKIGFDAYFHGNVGLLNNILGQMKKSRTRMIISLSTVVVYGKTSREPVSEQTLENPSNEYGLSKWMGDQILRHHAQEANWHCVCLRMPSLFGPDQEGGLIDTYYQAALRNEVIEIYSEGSLYRNLLHVDEAVRAVQQVVQKIKTLNGHQLFLLGSKNSLTMEQIAHHLVLRMHSGSAIKLSSQPAPIEAHWNLSLTKAEQQLDFHPMTIEEGIDKYLNQMSQHG